MEWRQLGLVFVLGMACGASAQGGPAQITLRTGLNEVDLDGDGTMDAVVKARWENGNAHSFWNYAFYRRGTKEGWDVVPVDFEEGRPRIGVNSSEGADCTLSDVRLVRSEGGSVELIVARREMGASYADRQPVTFAWFGLKTAEVPGEARLRFVKLRDQRTKAPYCDVGEALAKELGIK